MEKHSFATFVDHKFSGTDRIWTSYFQIKHCKIYYCKKWSYRFCIHFRTIFYKSLYDYFIVVTLCMLIKIIKFTYNFFRI